MIPKELKKDDFLTIVNKVQYGITFGRSYKITSIGFAYFTIVDDCGRTRHFSDVYLNKNSRLYMMTCKRLDRLEKLKEIEI